MLSELRVENLLLIERAEMRLGPGLNVLTGETGAGKTILAHALDLLLGGRPRTGIVRPGAAEAWVEGVFELSPQLRQRLGERLPADAQEVVLARRLSAEGRSRAYVCGRTSTVAELRDLGNELLAFYGQHEHRKLVLASSQLEILDGYCGPEQSVRRGAYARTHAEVRELSVRLDELRQRDGARERELDLLEFEIREIEEANPSLEESEALESQLRRLSHLEGLRQAALAGVEALAPESGVGGVASALAQAQSECHAVLGVDPALDEIAERMRALALEAEDCVGELRRYGDGVEAQPGRLDEVQERIGLLARLERKHGGSISDVLGHVDRCRARRDELVGAAESLEQVTAELGEAQARRDALDGELRAARAHAAPRLAESVRERLGELAMEGASFDVVMHDRETPGPTGGQTVEFLIAPNPGVPAAPLRETASGGELSRVMLGLMSVATESAGDRAGGGPELLVFDEVDAGIGGHTARVVGERLRTLARGRQVLCITHLPQIASLAQAHFRIDKDSSANPARTTVCELPRDSVVGELVRMLGAPANDLAARRHAQELLKTAA